MERIFNKLVRDRIPEIIKNKGEQEVSRKIENDVEFRALLLEKLLEEVGELREAEESKKAEEAADVLEVLYALCATYGITPKDIEEVRARKQNERGGFSERIFLEKTS